MKNPTRYFSVFLTVLLAACASKPVPPPVTIAPPVVVIAPAPEPLPVLIPALAPDPTPSPETRKVQELVQKWHEMRLNASAQYQTSANIIHWILLRTTLPAHAAQSEEIVREAARFAKQAGSPVQLLLTTSNKKDDDRLSKAIRNAAQQSGGNNSVKFDRLIETKAQSTIQIQVREAK